MLALHKVALKNFDRVLGKGGNYSKRACQPALAERAMANRTNGRLAMDNVSNCAARTTAGMGFVHRLLLVAWNGFVTANVALERPSKRAKAACEGPSRRACYTSYQYTRKDQQNARHKYSLENNRMRQLRKCLPVPNGKVATEFHKRCPGNQR